MEQHHLKANNKVFIDFDSLQKNLLSLDALKNTLYFLIRDRIKARAGVHALKRSVQR